MIYAFGRRTSKGRKIVLRMAEKADAPVRMGTGFILFTIWFYTNAYPDFMFNLPQRWFELGAVWVRAYW